MATLFARLISSFYGDLLCLFNNNSGIDATARNIATGNGNTSAAKLSTAGLNLPVDVSDVGNPPTDAQLDTAFGAPATVGGGFAAVLDDSDAETNCYLIWTDGTAWFHALGTKAV